ncbi:unnamed protein product [Orchesella dallaii]|uniref:Hexosyltransferase n=1 Tax=Orchesella dallaii TaxID=48710 RepID=A0ABP1R864_9HEXA
MGYPSVSFFGLVASVVLLLQLALHTQLLQRKPGSNAELSTDIVNQYSDLEDTSPSSLTDTLSPAPSIASIDLFTRFKRFVNENESTLPKTSTPQSTFYNNEIGLENEITNASNNNPFSGVSSKYLVKNFYSGNFLLPNAQLCAGKHKNLKLVVLVPTAIGNFKQRDSVRKTWGSFSARQDVVIGFMAGNPKLSHINDSTLELFHQEIDLFRDIIIADLQDSYQNLTLKSLFMIEWASTFCSSARFFMKTDDDVFLNVPLVLKFISEIEEDDSRQPKIYGNVFSGHYPQRDAWFKHKVSYKIYPHNMSYPNFTSGPSYLVSAKVLRPLLKNAVNLPLFNLEDVFLTGFVASSLDIPRINVTQFRNERENPFNMSACKLIKTIAGMTDGSPTQIYYVWYNYLMGGFICKYLKPR